MNDKLNEILKESNLTKLKATLVDFIDHANPFDEEKILDFIEGEYLCNYTQDENHNKYRVVFLQKWIEEEKQRINEEDKKLKSNDFYPPFGSLDFSLNYYNYCKEHYTLLYFNEFIEKRKEGLSEIEFAENELKRHQKNFEDRSAKGHPRGMSFYRDYVAIIKEYLTSKGWENPIPKEKYNYIFKDDSYQIHEKYCKIHSIDMTCRTDLRALYDFMKEDDLLNDLVELKDYIKFIKRKFGYTDDELKAISHPHSNPNQKRRNQYNAIKEATLKQP